MGGHLHFGRSGRGFEMNSGSSKRLFRRKRIKKGTFPRTKKSSIFFFTRQTFYTACYIACMLPLLCSSPPLPLASAQEQNADRNFLAKKAAIVEEYTKKKKSFADQISRLENEKRDLEDKAQGLNLKALKSKTLLTILSLSDFGITILLWFFPVMVLNHFLYLIIRKREFFARHRVLVITLFAAVEICFFLP